MMKEEMKSHHSKALENRNKGITSGVIEKVKSSLSKLISWLWAGGSQELCFTQPLPKCSNSSLHPWSQQTSSIASLNDVYGQQLLN